MERRDESSAGGGARRGGRRTGWRAGEGGRHRAADRRLASAGGVVGSRGLSRSPTFEGGHIGKPDFRAGRGGGEGRPEPRVGPLARRLRAGGGGRQVQAG